ncbi:MAG: chloramphenicol resistance protein [Oscillospiraceae bacterium]|nr:chloramphenicol resistance protein [Oscillospiraceae bacterium]
MADSITAGMREFLSTCPMIDGQKIKVNYLGDKAISYTLDEEPTEEKVDEFIDGSSIRKRLFIFASREAYSAAEIENMKVSAFFDSFSDWIESQSNAGNLPKLPVGCEAQSVEVLTSGYSMSADAETHKQRYQIQVALKYYKE